jgi:hypothetical protein
MPSRFCPPAFPFISGTFPQKIICPFVIQGRLLGRRKWSQSLETPEKPFSTGEHPFPMRVLIEGHIPITVAALQFFHEYLVNALEGRHLK